MYLHSILVIGGNITSQEQKLSEILGQIGIEEKENNPNIIKVSPDDEKSSLGIDKIRDLRLKLSIKSINKQPKIAIINMAHNLTSEAQNALLKTLEEPPENVYLILFSPNADLLLPTVVSRCQVIELSQDLPQNNSPKEQEKLTAILKWIEEGSVLNGFAWAKENTKRKEAIETLDKLLALSRQNLIPDVVRKLFQAKKYLLGNTNVRLTLENLFLA